MRQECLDLPKHVHKGNPMEPCYIATVGTYGLFFTICSSASGCEPPGYAFLPAHGVQRAEQQQEQRRQGPPNDKNYLHDPDNPPRPLLKRSVNGITELAGKPPPSAGSRRSAPPRPLSNPRRT